MPYQSLRDFLSELERRNDLRRIAVPVSTVLEMTEIHRRVLAAGGPALLLYAGGVLWTLGYDTLYACQDLADDARIGVRSSALRLGGRVLPMVQRFYVAAAALMGLGALAGGASVWFFAVFGAFFGGFLKYLQGVDISSPAAAMAAFKVNVWFGGVVWLALLLGTVYSF